MREEKGTFFLWPEYSLLWRFLNEICSSMVGSNEDSQKLMMIVESLPPRNNFDSRDNTL
jgi:hypothetical protein